MENVAIKGRGGNDVQHKNWKGKILRIKYLAINSLLKRNRRFKDNGREIKNPKNELVGTGKI